MMLAMMAVGGRVHHTGNSLQSCCDGKRNETILHSICKHAPEPGFISTKFSDIMSPNFVPEKIKHFYYPIVLVKPQSLQDVIGTGPYPG